MLSPTLRCRATAKINLGLRVLRRRDDGFHDVESVLIPIGWADELRAAQAPELTLSSSDPELPADGRNLVVRAAISLAGRAGVPAHAAIELDKRIPYGAGLGGGSSDAAAALRMLSELWGVSLPEVELREVASALGSDIPFFLGAGAALATGRGDLLTPVVDAAGAPYRLPFAVVVAVPPVRVATADAYRLVIPHDGDRPALVEAVISNDLVRWGDEIENDFQAPIAARHPQVANALSALAAAGAGFTSLSGSGSAVYGLFESPAAARAAGLELEVAGCQVWIEDSRPPVA